MSGSQHRVRFGSSFLAKALIGLCLCLAGGPLHAAPEKQKVVIAVGGKAALYYLPLTLAERLGYFKDEGLDVQILDFAGGSKALQAMMGGSADVVAGGFDHVIILRARGQKLKAFVLMVATPSLALGISKQRAVSYKSPRDLKGMKIGVTAPGSSTHIFVNHLLASVGLSPDDVSIIGVGTGPTAVAAMRAGRIDAIVNVEPAITMLERSRTIKVVTETMSEAGSRAVFGDLLPAGSLYTKEEFLQRNPETAQALANAMVRALKWLRTASAEDILKVIPPEFMLNDRATYLAALERSRPGYSRTGQIPPSGAATLYRVLRSFDPAVQSAIDLDVHRCYEDKLTKRANDQTR
jgi:NitT/TauT family transport system substrate-binding protein